MRHESQDVARRVADACDIIARAVRVGFRCRLAFARAVAKDDAVFALQLFKGGVVASVVAFGMSDWNAEHASRLQLIGKRRLGRLDANIDVIADEMQVALATERAGQESGFAQDLY